VPNCCLLSLLHLPYSYRQVLPTPSFVHRVDANATVFRDGTPVPSFLYTEVLSEVRSTCREPLRLHGKITSRYVFGVYLSVLCSCSIIYNTKLCVHTYIVYTTLAVNTACVGAAWRQPHRTDAFIYLEPQAGKVRSGAGGYKEMSSIFADQ
jgi:hypothetical protein